MWRNIYFICDSATIFLVYIHSTNRSNSGDTVVTICTSVFFTLSCLTPNHLSPYFCFPLSPWPGHSPFCCCSCFSFIFRNFHRCRHRHHLSFTIVPSCTFTHTTPSLFFTTCSSSYIFFQPLLLLLLPSPESITLFLLLFPPLLRSIFTLKSPSPLLELVFVLFIIFHRRIVN